MTVFVWSSGNGVFVSSSNWTPSGIPVAGDSATISGGIVVTDPDNLDIATLLLGSNTSLTLSNGGQITGSLVVSGGALLSDESLTGDLKLDGSGSVAEGVVSSGGAIYANDGSLNIGNTGRAALSVLSDGLVSAAQKLDIGINAGGSGSVVISGGELEYGTTLYVGNASGGSGSIIVEAGGVLDGTAPPGGSSAESLVGVNAGASGSVMVEGGGTVFNTDGNSLDIGLAGEGSLVVSGGAKVETGTTIPGPGDPLPALAVGEYLGGVGVVTVSGGGSVLSAAGQVVVGSAGSGSLVVSGGCSFLAGSANAASTGLIIGEYSGSGQVTVAGPGALLSVIGGLQVGNGGAAGLTISSGGVVDSDTVTVGSGGTLSLSAANGAAALLDVSGMFSVNFDGAVAGSGTINAAGALISGSYDASGLLLGGTVVDDGIINPMSGTLAIAGDVDGMGVVSIGSDATVVFESAFDAGADDMLGISFAGIGGTLDIEDLSAFDAVLSGYAPGDTMAVSGATRPPSYSESGGDTVLTFEDGETLTLAGLYASGSVYVDSDPIPACYATGTRIATPQGERPVEELSIGDTVLTASGFVRTIRWIGQRRYSGRFLARNPAVCPVRISSGALGEGVPRRDLLVSPKHAMFLDGVLVPAWLLVNGDSIARLTDVAEIDYRHLELDSHDVILAEGAASETFVDDASRGAFHNAHEFTARYPARGWAEPVYCAQRVEDGEELERINHAITHRALNRPGRRIVQSL